MDTALRPQDVALALHLLDRPGAGYHALAADLLVSSSTVHASAQRLKASGLVRATETGAGAVNRHALLEFLEHGVRYAFPAVPTGMQRGVPTAHAGPALQDEVAGDDPLVWADPDGSIYGRVVEPLLPRASRLVESAPHTYALLTAVDALRVGRARERDLARKYLRRALLHSAVPSASSGSA
ncbi:MAG: hypothetical protein IBJ03_10210 [Gemmatimonadaceae bacterium]|nr:hypothetical protein [Gemmatimonadaceae bacterium]